MGFCPLCREEAKSVVLTNQTAEPELQEVPKMCDKREGKKASKSFPAP